MSEIPSFFAPRDPPAAAPVTEDDVAAFLTAASEKLNAERKLLPAYGTITLGADHELGRYVRIWWRNGPTRMLEAFCFIDRQTGYLVGAEGWLQMDGEVVRGTVHSPYRGAEYVSLHGLAQRRGQGRRGGE